MTTRTRRVGRAPSIQRRSLSRAHCCSSVAVWRRSFENTDRVGIRAHSRRTFLIPSIPDLVFAGLVCLQVAAASLILLNRDGDLPRHIAVGRVMLEHRTLVREDFFSHTAYGQPFLAMEWGSQVIFAALY